MTQHAQLVLSVDQLELIAASLRTSENDPDLTLDESVLVSEIRYFIEQASEQPGKFPVTGKMASALKKRASGLAGTRVLVQHGPNKRKARQEKRQGGHKQRRKYRAVIAKSYNEARLIQEREDAEIAAIHAEDQARWDAQPKFEVVATDGTVLMTGVPEEFIRPVPVEELTEPKPEIVLP